MDHLLGALSPELEELREAEEGSDSDDGQVSGTDQGSEFVQKALAWIGASTTYSDGSYGFCRDCEQRLTLLMVCT